MATCGGDGLRAHRVKIDLRAARIGAKVEACAAGVARVRVARIAKAQPAAAAATAASLESSVEGYGFIADVAEAAAAKQLVARCEELGSGAIRE